MQDKNKGAHEALTWIVDAVQKHRIVSPACVEIGELNGLKAFTSGQHAFAMLGRYRIRTLNDPKQSQIAPRARQALMPRGPHGKNATVGWNRFYGLTTAAAKDKAKAAEAVKFIEWFGGKADGQYAFQKLMFMDVGSGFAVKPLFKDPDIIKAYNQYSDIKMYEKQEPRWPESERVHFLPSSRHAKRLFERLTLPSPFAGRLLLMIAITPSIGSSIPISNRALRRLRRSSARARSTTRSSARPTPGTSCAAGLSGGS